MANFGEKIVKASLMIRVRKIESPYRGHLSDGSVQPNFIFNYFLWFLGHNWI